MKTLMNTTLATLLALVPAAAAADTIKVPAQQSTIQAAIDAAAAGDTIVIAPGVYDEDLVIPAGKDGLVLSGKGALVAGGRPCSWTKQSMVLATLEIKADGVTVDGLQFDGMFHAPKYEIPGAKHVAQAAKVPGLSVDGVTKDGMFHAPKYEIPGSKQIALAAKAPGLTADGLAKDGMFHAPKYAIVGAGTNVTLADLVVNGGGIVLLGGGATVTGCTVEAVAGAAVQLLPGEDQTVCTWAGNDPLLGKLAAVLMGAPPATGATVLANNVFIDVKMALRVTGLTAGRIVLDGNEVQGEAPMLVADQGAGTFQVLVRGLKGGHLGAAYLLEDAVGMGVTIQARGFVLAFDEGEVALFGDAQILGKAAPAAGLPAAPAATFKLAGTFFGDTPVVAGPMDAAGFAIGAPAWNGATSEEGNQGLSLSGQAAN